MKFKCLLVSIATLTSPYVLAQEKSSSDCNGLYVGKTYYLGSGKWEPKKEVKIIGIDKEEQLITIQYDKGARENLEFNGCKRFKDIMEEGKNK